VPSAAGEVCLFIKKFGQKAPTRRTQKSPAGFFIAESDSRIFKIN
jgi:hypothetical protein